MATGGCATALPVPLESCEAVCECHGTETYRELHSLDGERISGGLVAESGVLLDEGVEPDKRNCVSAGYVLYCVLLPTHAQHCALHGLVVEVLLLTRDVVASHNAHLHVQHGGLSILLRKAERKRARR